MKPAIELAVSVAIAVAVSVAVLGLAGCLLGGTPSSVGAAVPDGAAHAPLPSRYQWDEREWCYYADSGETLRCASDSEI